MKTYITLLSFLFFTNSAWSGNEKGNGGLALYCSALPSQLFDFYESVNLHHFVFRKDLAQGDEWVIVLDVVQGIEARVPELAALLRNDFEIFKANSRFLKGELGLSDDTKHVFLPDGCELKQAVLQRKNILTGKIDFFISEKVWGDLSSLQKAGLILHEALYKNSNQNDSRGVRRLTGFLFSQSFNLSSEEEIAEELKNAGVKYQ
jgi:hypothetical protein